MRLALDYDRRIGPHDIKAFGFTEIRYADRSHTPSRATVCSTIVVGRSIRILAYLVSSFVRGRITSLTLDAMTEV